MSGEPLGPLHGVPVSIKDLIPTKGVRTTFGSIAFADNVPDRDDVLVTRLRAAGAIMIGKTTTPEFGIKGQTDAPIYGVTRNPWNLDRTPGGSSGGAAAAVAVRHRADRPRQRRRGIDPHSGRVLRARRPQGHDRRHSLSGSARRLRQCRRGGSAHADDRRLRGDASR